MKKGQYANAGPHAKFIFNSTSPMMFNMSGSNYPYTDSNVAMPPMNCMGLPTYPYYFVVEVENKMPYGLNYRWENLPVGTDSI